MTAPDVAARVAAWLDRLEGLHTAAAGGEWKVTAQGGIDAGDYDTVISGGPVDCMAYCYGGSSTLEGDNLTADAAAIVAEHNAFGSLLALARGVAELADTFTELADLNAARADEHEQAERHVDAQYRHGRAVSYLQAATALRDLLADAAPDTGEETA